MKIFTFLCFVWMASPLFSQQTGTVRGVLNDTDQLPLEFVSVYLTRPEDATHMIAGATTDEFGAFTIKNIPLGTYELKAQFLGFQTLSKIITISVSNQQQDMGSLVLETDTTLLQGVQVTAQRKLVQKTPQGLIINAEATLSQQGGSAIDLLRNTPTIFVDAEGGITLRGKSPLILLNGRNSSLTNLENIPASSIASIEIITSPGAQYDASAENGILNIILKKGEENGTNGAFAIGYGYGSKWRANSSAQLNHNTGSFNVAASYDNRFANRTRKVDGDRVNFLIPDRYYLTQRRADDRQERNHNLKLNLDQEFKKGQLGFEWLAAFTDEDNYEALVSNFDKQDGSFTSANRRFSQELRRASVNELALNYEHKFTDPEQKLSLGLSSSFYRSKENTNIDTQDRAADASDLGDPYLQRTNFDENGNITNFKADYSQKLGSGTFEGGYKLILRSTDDDFRQQNQINGVFESVPAQTGVLHFKEQIHAFYAQQKGPIGVNEKAMLEYEAGLRLEQTNNEGKLVPQGDTFQANYLSLFPSIGLTHRFSESSFLRLGYNRRINRPSLGQLNPFTDITDSLSQHSGNPNLKPELVNALELNFSKDFQHTGISAKVFYRSGKNPIMSYTELRSDGVLLSRPENVGSQNIYGLESIFTFSTGTIWKGNLSYSIFQQNIDAGNIGVVALNTQVSGNLKLINDLTFWKGGQMQIIGVYNSPVATVQGTRVALYYADMAFQQKIWKERGRLGIIFTDIFDSQRGGYNLKTPEFQFDRRFKIDTRAFLVTLGYTFGTKFKEELMENQFEN
ncbi:MAG: TonB-dependent receptor [Maribacter sp.]|nr:TonB-dependent receptor [Maribacter sp.]